MDALGGATSRLTRSEYERPVGLGAFRPGEPIELIGGQLVGAEPQGASHYTASSRPLLAVGVAGSSLHDDRARKGSLSARTGPAEYWIRVADLLPGSAPE